MSDLVSKLVALLAALWAAVKAYPHGSALVINLGVLALARIGLRLTPVELVAVVGAVNVGMAALVRGNTATHALLKGK